MLLLKTNRALRSVINSLEDENKVLKRKNEDLTKDNIILLDNSFELRAKIKGLECILEATMEKKQKEIQPKKRGRKPKTEKEAK